MGIVQRPSAFRAMESVKPIVDVSDLGKLCHQINRAYCQTIGDNSQVDWDVAPQWQRESAVKGVQYFIEHPNVTPEGMHFNWVKDKMKDGWKYGPVKDAEKKEHPCMVEYEKLVIEQRMKDHLFLAVCKSYFKVY